MVVVRRSPFSDIQLISADGHSPILRPRFNPSHGTDGLFQRLDIHVCVMVVHRFSGMPSQFHPDFVRNAGVGEG